MPIKLLVYFIVIMQYQNNLFLDTKSSAENKYLKFVKYDASLPNGEDGASARKRSSPQKKKNFQCYRPAKTNGAGDCGNFQTRHHPELFGKAAPFG